MSVQAITARDTQAQLPFLRVLSQDDIRSSITQLRTLTLAALPAALRDSATPSADLASGCLLYMSSTIHLATPETSNPALKGVISILSQTAVRLEAGHHMEVFQHIPYLVSSQRVIDAADAHRMALHQATGDLSPAPTFAQAWGFIAALFAETVGPMKSRTEYETVQKLFRQLFKVNPSLLNAH